MRRCSGPTSSSMNDCRAGFSNALLSPSMKREHADLPQSHRVRHREQTENQRLDAHHRLQRDHHLALVDAVGDDAAVRSEDQHRQRLQRDDHAERRGGVRERQHQPRLSRHLHPGTDQRDRLAAEVEPVVGNLERREGRAARRAVSAGSSAVPMEVLGELLKRRQRGLDQRAVLVRELGERRLHAPASAGRGCVRGELAPAGVASSQAERRSSLVGRARHEPVLREVGDRARQQRRVETLLLGDLGRAVIGPLRTVLSSTATRVGVRSAARLGLGRPQHASKAPEHDPQPLRLSPCRPLSPSPALLQVFACWQAS